MNDGYNKFYKRMLVLAKADADLLNWFAMGFLVGIVHHYAPAPYCPIPVFRQYSRSTKYV